MADGKDGKAEVDNGTAAAPDKAATLKRCEGMKAEGRVLLKAKETREKVHAQQLGWLMVVVMQWQRVLVFSFCPLVLLRATLFSPQGVEVMAKALELMVTSHDELSLECGPFYVAYGQALVQQAQATASALGGGGGGEDDEEKGAPQPPEEADDTEVAWETLEVARVIYSGAAASKENDLVGCMDALAH